MQTNKLIKTYSPLEERINIGSHALGAILSIIALLLLVQHRGLDGDLKASISFIVFGLSLITLYLASTFYHASKQPIRRARLRVIDHAAIYVLIAGTYTPFTVITLNSTTGWTILCVAWGLALAGSILKIRYTGRYTILSTSMYVAMGWLIIFAIQPLRESLPASGQFWLALGGLSYTMGAIIYSIRHIPLNHAIFHVFILIGSICHFIAVYFYVLPVK